MQTCVSGWNTPLTGFRQPAVASVACHSSSRQPQHRRCTASDPYHGRRLAQGQIRPRHKPQRILAAPAAWGAPSPTAPPEPALRTLYPASKVHDSGMLQVSDLHFVYYEVHGNPNGVPALFLHGGPGAGCWANHARFFDPAHYKVILVDQRGCGRSTPRGCLQDNHTAALVGDCEQLRQHLGLQRWGVVLGGSWGVTLALAYAQAHPDRVASLVLRGVCLMRPHELQWMYGGGAAALKPRAWEAFLSHLEPWQRGNPLLGYYQRLLSPVAAVRDAAAHAWMSWEMSVGFGSKGLPLMWDGAEWRSSEAAPKLPPKPRPTVGAFNGMQPSLVSSSSSSNGSNSSSSNGSNSSSNNRSSVKTAAAPQAPAQPTPWVWGLPGEGANAERPEVQQLLLQGLMERGGPGAAAQALLECHYSLHGGFLLDAPLLEHMDRVRHIPCIAVHGQLDFVCPAANAYALHTAWPEMELHMVPNSGHSMYEPAITHELVQATDRMRAVVAHAAVPAPAKKQPALGSGAAAAAAGPHAPQGSGRNGRAAWYRAKGSKPQQL